jgi:tRNA G37 N-methylase Trm5
MAFNDKLRNRLKGKLTGKELDHLPKGYQIIGNILLIKLDKRLVKHRRLIGKTIMDMLPYIHTVCLIKDIRGSVRKPEV